MKDFFIGVCLGLFAQMLACGIFRVWVEIKSRHNV